MSNKQKKKVNIDAAKAAANEDLNNVAVAAEGEEDIVDELADLGNDSIQVSESDAPGDAVIIASMDVKNIKSAEGFDNMARFTERAKALFKDYPKADELLFTADGFAFFNEPDANCHANSLKDNSVVKIERQ